MTDKVPLLLMAEFGSAEPLWLRTPDGKASRAVPVDHLPMTTELQQRLRAWAVRHDKLNDPPFSWGSRAELESFADEGCALLEQVRSELGDTYDVQDRVGN